MKISVLFLTLLRTKLTIAIKLLILVSSFLFLTLVASPSAAAENLDLELRKLSNTIKLLILVSSFLFLTLVASPGIEPGSGASETLILSIVLRGHVITSTSKRTLLNL
jgi:hypothetical protein